MNYQERYNARLIYWPPVALFLRNTVLRFKHVLLICLMLCLLFVPTALHAQTLNLQFKNERLENILSAVKKQSGYNFVINGNVLKETSRISVSVSGVSLQKGLTEILRNTALEYRIEGRSIIITRKRKAVVSTSIADADILSAVHGCVVDENGMSLPGATVDVQYGKQNLIQAKTDAEGCFSIANVPGNATIVVSFMGYAEQQLKPSSEMGTVKLHQQIAGLDEVLVVGYTTATRQDNLASVVQVESKDIMKQNVSNLADAIVGRLPGLIVRRSSGNPPGSSPTVSIRGQNTLSGNTNTPLLVVDGVPTDVSLWSSFNPNDIESVSVVKDAAAAVYGARAANGVILITTKRGQAGKPVIKYGGSMNLEFPSLILKSLDSWQYATLYNLAEANDARLADGSIPAGFVPTYSDEEIQTFMDGSDPDHYANTDWYDETILAPAVNQFHNLSIRGGGEQARYFISAGYNSQGGLIRNVSNDRYTLRSNIDMDVNKNLLVGVDFSASLNNTNDPLNVEMIYNTPPIYANQYVSDPNKYGGYVPGGTIFRNPYVESINGDYSKVASTVLSGILHAEQKIPFVPGLSVKGLLSYYRSAEDVKSWGKNAVIYTDDGTYVTLTDYGGAALSNTADRWDNLTVEGQIKYNNTFGKHGVKGILVLNQTQQSAQYFSAMRTLFTSVEIDQLDFGDLASSISYGNESSSSRRSMAGQFGYQYDGRYLLDFNFRYDGSSNFLNRWGFFPAVSAGWNIARESFIKKNNSLSFIDLLKLRASYGIVGNDLISRTFGFLDQYALTAAGLVVDGNTELSIAPSSLGNTAITWEKERSLNLGLDFDLWKGLLGGSVDVFYKERVDILNTPAFAYPSTFGISLPYQNNSSVSNKGFEISLSHSRSIGEFRYAVRPNFAFSTSKIIYIPETQTNPLLVRSGRTQDYYTFGYVALGLFESAEDIANSPAQTFGTVQPGDIKYADISGPAGVPDGVINSYDRTRIGTPSAPRIQFGLATEFSYKAFDLSLLFQGTAKSSVYYSGSPAIAFTAYQPTIYEHHLDYWAPDNLDATYPRLSLGTANNWQTSSYWVHDASYVRLKSATLGYNMDTTWLRKAGLNGLRIFLSGTNIFTVDGLEFYDPEATGQSYPLPKTFTFGLDVTF